MLLVIDVGNTNMTFGIMDGRRIAGRFRLTTGNARTSDEYAFIVEGLIRQQGIELSQIEDLVVSSVVPGAMHSLNNGCQKIFGKKPFTVGPGTKTGIRIVTANPAEIGADRIVDAAGAFELYGGPVIVIDFGTATTYDLIGEQGEFLAGITSPGIRICAKALWEDTAKLPEIEIRKPASILAGNTIESMQAGLVYGYIGQTEYIINRVKKEYGREDVKVVATGGLGRIIAGETEHIQVYDPDLTLLGLQIIYEKNAQNRRTV